MKSSLLVCTCTSPYFCHDENQWEPGIKCTYCLEEEQILQEAQGCFLTFSQNPVFSFPELVPALEQVQDDLPF